MKRKICSILLVTAFLLVALCPAMTVFVLGAKAENLVLGMSYTIQTGVPTAHSYDNFEEGGVKYDIDKGQLTDGVRAEGGPSDRAWYHAFRSQSRIVTFAFEQPVAVTGFSAGFYHGAGYYAPRYVKLMLSEDGMSWFTAGSTGPKFALNASAQRYQAELQLKKTYAAQYVRVEFCCDIFACCDEIEILGQPECTGKETAYTPDEPGETYYCTSLAGDPYGISDIVKVYNGYYPSAPDTVRNTADDLLPYVAYLSADGKIKDTMFDAVAFVPCVSTNFSYPSGGTLVKTAKYPPAIQSDWVFYTDYLFEKGYELDALNTAVGKVQKALGKTEKFPVLLTMPYPGVMDRSFGDINGDGNPEFCRTTAERIAIVEWYNTYLTERFEAAHLDNLEFVGYYWYEEEHNYSWSADEKAFTAGALKALENAGKPVLFDPFYLSVGFDHWQELGFEGAVMQPNVAFTENRSYFDLDMLWEFAEAANTYHLGVEIETNEPSFFTGDRVQEACLNYERYLYVGWKTGYMDALHTFYQSAGPGTLYTFCHSDSARLRRLYDITYTFIKGTYANEPPVFEGPESAEVYAGEKNAIQVSLTDPDSFGGDVKVVISGCEHGRAQLSAQRNALLYLPDSEYTGEDVIRLTVDDGHNEAQTYEIPVQVVQRPAEESSTPSESVSGETSAEESVTVPVSTPSVAESSAPAEDDGVPVWLITAIILGFLVLSVTVTVVILRKLK